MTDTLPVGIDWVLGSLEAGRPLVSRAEVVYFASNAKKGMDLSRVRSEQEVRPFDRAGFPLVKPSVEDVRVAYPDSVE